MALAEIFVFEPRIRACGRPPENSAPQKRAELGPGNAGERIEFYSLNYGHCSEPRYSPGELAHYETGAQADAMGRCASNERRAQTRDSPAISRTSSPCCCAVPFPR
jgi:hypothetical protein